MSTYLWKLSDLNFCCRGDNSILLPHFMLRPVLPNQPYLFSIFYFEYPSVFDFALMIFNYFVKPNLLLLLNTTWINSIHYRFNMNFCATPCLFLELSQKVLVVERLNATKLKISSNREIFIVHCTRQSEGNLARNNVISVRFFVGISAFVKGLSRISSFFSSKSYFCIKKQKISSNYEIIFLLEKKI